MTATIEDVKKFWNDRPCNVRHSSKEVGTLEYFNEVSNKKFFVEPHIIDFTDFASWRSKKVLEVGCGLATAGIEFANLEQTILELNFLKRVLILLDNGLMFLLKLENFIPVMQKSFLLLFPLKLMI